LTQARASSFRSKQLTDLNWTLAERQILLCLQETDLEVQEAILVEEQVRGLRPPDGQDLTVELEEICVRMDGISGEHAVEAGDYHSWLWGFSMP
jgi:hypothetical protein